MSGRVESGHGDASRWLSRFNAEYATKAGMPIFPGSLNLRLNHLFDWSDEAIGPLLVEFARSEYGGERDILLLPCLLRSLGDMRAYLWTTTNGASSSHDVVEIITSLGLRDHFGLSDGDMVELEVGWGPVG
ncbi:MAG: DUF120 domain-containing protein [Gemmatimonadetes bacterium]|nr:DUF120 domain-containing protein [Gemmatimonadota bacterium]MDA1104512.1 DUF120 domain-containing protein [Gemmatimonadota bacterium]